MKNYKEFKVTTKPLNNELVSGLLWQLDIDGINETDSGLIVFADATKDISRDDVEKILTGMIYEKLIDEFTIEEETFEDKNWNEEYEKKVNVIEVTDKIVIKPSFKEYSPKPNQIIITIDPKMSFGTGEHATTKLVLQLIEKYVKTGNKVLDVGSGTGVLAISSVMLGAKSALGIDNDEWCLLNGNENVTANNLEGKVEIRMAEINQISETGFDLIVANINKHILLEIAASIKTKSIKNGRLILSGLLRTDKEEILQMYTKLGYGLLDSADMDEWCALVFQLMV
ncbi:MAG: 50S ribosomal protein L11 methyltransferase [Bacteroidetes bacterium]|nr:50S ribosomal protein L11 methyltransferase [Bacteroidota bacterium]